MERRTTEIEAVPRKRKLICIGGESDFSTSSIQLKNPRLAPENSPSISQTSANDDSASCCSSNGSTELSKFVDLDDEDNHVEFFTTSVGGDSFDSCRERRETSTPLKEAARAEKMPSEAELEEFFAVAEKKLQKKFIDKYNYDIVKDEPVEGGRYEWVQLQIKP